MLVLNVLSFVGQILMNVTQFLVMSLELQPASIHRSILTPVFAIQVIPASTAVKVSKNYTVIKQ